MSSREEFCRLWSSPGTNRSELCHRFGVSRPAGYKWAQRYAHSGPAGLGDRSRRPHMSPEQTPAEIEAEVLSVRTQHPVWGGRKIRRVLQNADRPAPSASTITAILRRAGMLDGPRAGERRAFTRFTQAAPNDLWQMDFKGDFALAAGRCHPLTVLDDHSRYALEIGACGDQRTETVQQRLTAVFRRHGLPRRILADNGSPWGTAGSAARHTRLTVWLLDLGVGIVHGRPYHSQTQGKDERFHRTLAAEVLDGRSFADLHRAQAAFDAWRGIYNTVRPHEALGLEVPACRYRMSPRPLPETIAAPDYGPAVPTRKVHETGWISFRGRSFNCSKAFAGRRLALRATTTDGLFDLCYRSHVLAQIDLRQDPTPPVNHVPEQL